MNVQQSRADLVFYFILAFYSHIILTYILLLLTSSISKFLTFFYSILTTGHFNFLIMDAHSA